MFDAIPLVRVVGTVARPDGENLEGAVLAVAEDAVVGAGVVDDLQPPQCVAEARMVDPTEVELVEAVHLGCFVEQRDELAVDGLTKREEDGVLEKLRGLDE